MGTDPTVAILQALLDGPDGERAHVSQADQARLEALLPALAEVIRPERQLVRQLGDAAESGSNSSSDGQEPRTSFLAAIEGIDGAGKGTQARLLLEKAVAVGLRAYGVSFPRYRETVFGRVIGDYLNGRFGNLESVPPQFSALLFAADRFESKEHLDAIRHRCDLVVLDRYVASNVAYQGARIPPDYGRAFAHWLFNLEYQRFGLPSPDLNLFLDVPIPVASAWVLQKGPRSYTDAAADIHERSTQYMLQCREMFVQLQGSGRQYGEWNRVSGAEGPPQTIASEIWRIVESRLDERHG